MLLAVLTSVLATIWVLYCIGLLAYRYFVETLLGKYILLINKYVVKIEDCNLNFNI